MKKKIGVLTLPLHKNYGGLLQAYALLVCLKKLDYETVLLNRKPNSSIIKNFLRSIVYFKRERNIKQAEKNTRYFIEKYINPKTEILNSNNKINNIVAKLNLYGIVVGSDQVWRNGYSNGFYLNYFFDFIQDNSIKKVSYAASFGEDQWKESKELTNNVTKLLQDFDKVSVREKSSLKLCKENFNVDSEQHLDPTLLLTPDEYKTLFNEEKEPISKGDVLVYMLDINDDRQKTIGYVSEYLKGKAFSVNSKGISGNENHEKVYPTVTSWLRGFYDAKFVVTDSFHGTIFSILFNKPFVAYGNVDRGLSRFISVLKMFGLENRLILKYDDLDDEMLTKKIDWKNINDKLKVHRERSFDYLKGI